MPELYPIAGERVRKLTKPVCYRTKYIRNNTSFTSGESWRPRLLSPLNPDLRIFNQGSGACCKLPGGSGTYVWKPKHFTILYSLNCCRLAAKSRHYRKLPVHAVPKLKNAAGQDCELCKNFTVLTSRKTVNLST